MPISGANKHRARLARLAKAKPVLKAVVYAAADALRVEAAISITRGAVSGANHVASLPGEPPNADSHFLADSIHVERVDDLTAHVVADAPYAVALEYGTSQMAERPFMRPAAKLIRPEMNRKIAAAIRKLARS